MDWLPLVTGSPEDAIRQIMETSCAARQLRKTAGVVGDFLQNIKAGSPLHTGLAGAAVGGGLGLLNEVRKPQDERNYENAAIGAATGGVLGGAGGAAVQALGDTGRAIPPAPTIGEQIGDFTNAATQGLNKALDSIPGQVAGGYLAAARSAPLAVGGLTAGGVRAGNQLLKNVMPESDFWNPTPDAARIRQAAKTYASNSTVPVETQRIFADLAQGSRGDLNEAMSRGVSNNGVWRDQRSAGTMLKNWLTDKRRGWTSPATGHNPGIHTSPVELRRIVLQHGGPAPVRGLVGSVGHALGRGIVPAAAGIGSQALWSWLRTPRK